MLYHSFAAITIMATDLDLTYTHCLENTRMCKENREHEWSKYMQLPSTGMDILFLSRERYHSHRGSLPRYVESKQKILVACWN
jgi:hypothetical protein